MCPPVDYDYVRARWHGILSPSARDAFPDAETAFDRDGAPVWIGYLGRHGRDFRVRQKYDLVRIEGSTHKAALGESVGVHGPAEIGAFLGGLAGRMGVDPDRLLEAEVSRLDLGANLPVPRPVAEYVRLTAPPPRTFQRYRRPGSVAFGNTSRQLILYDKVAKVRRTERRRGVALLPPEMAGRNVLRAELRVERVKPTFGGPVTLGALCDPDFYERAAGEWSRRFSEMPLDGGGLSLDPGGPFPRTVPELRDGLAAVGVAASGGASAVVGRIDDERSRGALGANPASRMRGWVRGLASRHVPASDAALVGDLRDAVRRAHLMSLGAAGIERAARDAARGHGPRSDTSVRSPSE